MTVLHGAYYSYCVLPNVYFGTALVEVGSPDSNASLVPEIATIRSKIVLSPVIHALSLDKIWAKRVYKTALDALPEEDALSFLGKVLHVSTKAGSNVISIRFASEVPQEAADVPNAIADQYLHELKEMDDSRAAEVLERAVPPKEPTLPNHLVDLIYTVLEGMILAIPIGLFMEWMWWYVATKATNAPALETKAQPSEEY